MDGYRLYLFGDDGHIRDGVELECDSDEQAIKTAGAYGGGCAMELWQAKKMVAQFPKREIETTASVNGPEATF